MLIQKLAIVASVVRLTHPKSRDAARMIEFVATTWRAAVDREVERQARQREWLNEMT